MFIKNKKQVYKKIGVNLGISALVLLIALFGVQFLSKKISAISESSYQARKNTLLLNSSGDQQILAQQNLKNIGNGYQVIEKALPNADNILGFVTNLETIEKNNLSLPNNNFDVPAPYLSQGGVSISKINYNSNLSMDLPGFLNFLKNYEQLPYFTKINNINITATQQGWQSKSVINLSSEVYVTQ